MANESASIPAATGVSETESYKTLGVEAISQAVPVTHELKKFERGTSKFQIAKFLK